MVNLTLYLKFEKDSLEAAVKKLGYRSINQWFNIQAERMIAEAEGRKKDPEMAVLIRASQLSIQIEALRKHLKKDIPRLRQLYLRFGGKPDLSNLDDPSLWAKMYEAYEFAKVAAYKRLLHLRKEEQQLKLLLLKKDAC